MQYKWLFCASLSRRAIPDDSGSICCTIKIGTEKSAGKLEINISSAFNPPAEAPITIMRENVFHAFFIE